MSFFTDKSNLCASSILYCWELSIMLPHYRSVFQEEVFASKEQ